MILDELRAAGDRLEWYPPGLRGQEERVEAWLLWLGARELSGALPLQLFEAAARQVRRNPRPPPGSPLRTAHLVQAVRRAYEARRDATVDLELAPAAAALTRWGAPVLLAFAARRGAAMLEMIPESIRNYVFLLVGTALAAIQWAFGFDTESIAATLGAASAGQVAVVRAKLLKLGAEGWKTWAIVGFQALVYLAMIGATLTGHAALAATVGPTAIKVMDLITDATLTHAAQKVLDSPATEVAANVREAQASP